MPGQGSGLDWLPRPSRASGGRRGASRSLSGWSGAPRPRRSCSAAARTGAAALRGFGDTVDRARCLQLTEPGVVDGSPRVEPVGDGDDLALAAVVAERGRVLGLVELRADNAAPLAGMGADDATPPTDLYSAVA